MIITQTHRIQRWTVLQVDHTKESFTKNDTATLSMLCLPPEYMKMKELCSVNIVINIGKCFPLNNVFGPRVVIKGSMFITILSENADGCSGGQIQLIKT